jgi:hypothetical protein
MKHFFPHFFLLFLLSICSINTWSQADFRPGYLVKNNGDTLRGLIDYRTNEPLFTTRCTYKSNVSAQSQTFAPNEVKSFLFEGNKYVVSFVLPDSTSKDPVFAQRLASGMVNLNRYLNRYFVEKPGRKTFELIQTQKEVTKDGEDFIVPEKKYIATLNSYFADCRAMSGKLERLELLEKDLIKVVNKYNECIGKAAIINQSDQSAVVLSPKLGIWAGTGSFEVTEDRSPQNLFDRVPFSAGLIAAPVVGLEVSLPRTIPNLFVNVEMMLLQKKHSGSYEEQQARKFEGEYEANFGFLRMPLGIGYLQPGYGKKFLFFAKAGTSLNLSLTKAEMTARINLISPSETIQRSADYGSSDFRPTQLSTFWGAIGLRQNKKGFRFFAETRFELEQNPMTFRPNKDLPFSRGTNFGLHFGAYF